MGAQLDFLLLALTVEDVSDVFDETLGNEVNFAHRKYSAFKFGQIQDVFDQTQQLFGGTQPELDVLFDAREVVLKSLALSQLVVVALEHGFEPLLDERVEVDHAVERSPQLVRRAGEHDALTADAVVGLLQLEQTRRVDEHVHVSGSVLPDDFERFDAEVLLYLGLLDFFFRTQRCFGFGSTVKSDAGLLDH